MGDVKRENRLLFCALALFFFVFLESTLFFQTNLAQPGGHGPFLSQFPIQGASALGLLAFPLNNRLVGEKGRPVFMGTVTVLGVASLVGVVFASSPLVIACMGAVGFFLIGLAGATVYWATCVRSRSIARFATLIGSSHALGVLAQIPLLEFTSNHLVEAVVLSASIIALGVINARIWPPRSALAEFSAQREQRKGKRLESSKFAGWRLGHMTPRTAVIVIFALVLLFSVLSNTLYTFIDIGSPWTSQYTNITPRVLMAVGGFAGGVLFDLHRARYLGIAMFWMMLLSVGAMLGVEAGGPYVVGEVVYFLGSGVFMTFYTAVFVWIAQFLRAPDLWCSMGRALNNVTAIAIGAPALLVINLTSPIAVVVLLIPLIIGINALLFAAGMLDLSPRPRGGETGGRAGKQAGAPPRLRRQHHTRSSGNKRAHACCQRSRTWHRQWRHARQIVSNRSCAGSRGRPGTRRRAFRRRCRHRPRSAPCGFRRPFLAHAARDRGACRRHRRRAPAQACGGGHGHLPARAPAAPDLAVSEDRHAIPRRPHETVLGVAPSARPRLRTRPFARPGPHAKPSRQRGSPGGYVISRQNPAKPFTRFPALNGADDPQRENPAATEVATGFRISEGADSRSLPFSEAPAYAALRLAVATMVFTPLTASTTASTNSSTANSACTAGAKMSPPFMMSRVFW